MYKQPWKERTGAARACNLSQPWVFSGWYIRHSLSAKKKNSESWTPSMEYILRFPQFAQELNWWVADVQVWILKSEYLLFAECEEKVLTLIPPVKALFVPDRELSWSPDGIGILMASVGISQEPNEARTRARLADEGASIKRVVIDFAKREGQLRANSSLELLALLWRGEGNISQILKDEEWERRI